jgi:hypothetical protein
MKIVHALVLSCLLASLALAQEASTSLAPPEVEILFSYVGQRTMFFVNTTEIPRVPGEINATSLLPYRAEISADPLNRQAIFVNERQRQNTNYAFLRVRNAGSKPIKAIDWEVPYLHVKNNRGLTRHVFHSKVNIAPGATDKIEKIMPRPQNQLTMTALSGPAGKHDLTQGGLFIISNNDNSAPSFDTFTYRAKNGFTFDVPADWQRDRIRINRIEYADGTVWQR